MSPFTLNSGREVEWDTRPVTMGLELLPSVIIQNRLTTRVLLLSLAPEFHAWQKEESHHFSGCPSEVASGKFPKAKDSMSRWVTHICLSTLTLIPLR